MKKLICGLLVIVMLMPAIAFADMYDGYFLNNVPEILESETKADFYVAKVIRVNPGWDSVYHDDYIDTYLITPFPNEKLYSVILTDGYEIVHGYIERIGDNFTYIQFETTNVRRFLLNYCYLVLICTDCE